MKDRKLAFCNNCNTSQYISDCTKDYEIDRYRPVLPENGHFDELQKQQLTILEQEQVILLKIII